MGHTQMAQHLGGLILSSMWFQAFPVTAHFFDCHRLDQRGSLQESLGDLC